MEDQRTSSPAPSRYDPKDIARKKAFLIRFFYAAVILGIAIFVCRKAIPALTPFVIALVVSLLLKPIVHFLHDTCHVQKNIASFIVVLLFYALVGMLIIVLGAKLIATIRNAVLLLPSYYMTRVEPLLYELGDLLQDFFTKLDPAVASTLNGYLSDAGAALSSAVTGFSMSALKFLTNFAISMPSLLVDTIIMIIATVFITTDLPLIKRFLLHQCSEKTQHILNNVGTHLSRTLVQYVRSYGLILSITFVELCIGLSIIGINRVPLVSLLIAVFDILPVVGCGTVLIPWTIISVVLGDFRRAASVGILYIIITTIRNYIEPKIIGNTIGLHPIVTLSSMVIGVYLFGGIGLLGLPVTLALFTSLNNAGVIHWFSYPEGDEPVIKQPNEKKASLFGKKKTASEAEPASDNAEA